MKTLITVTTLLTLLILMPGCQKNSTVGDYYMTAKIGADTFSATGLSSAYLSTSTLLEARIITIYQVKLPMAGLSSSHWYLTLISLSLPAPYLLLAGGYKPA